MIIPPRVFSWLWPWPTAAERRRSIAAAVAERYRSRQSLIAALRLRGQLDALVFEDNHFAELMASQIREGR